MGISRRYARSLVWGVGTLSVVAILGCASKKTEVANNDGDESKWNRAPAAQPVGIPYVPPGANNPPHAYPNNPNNPNYPNNPNNPPHAYPTPNPVAPPTTEVAVQAACLQRQVLPNRQWTVAQVLMGLKIPPGSLVTRGMFFIDWNVDPDLLRPVFGTRLDPGSAFYQMAKYSSSFQRALNFVEGTGQTNARYSGQDYLQNGRLAWMMALLIASKDDKECVRRVLADADAIVGSSLAAELRALPFEATTQLVANGSLPTSFSLLEQARQEHIQKRADLELQMRQRELDHSVQLRELQLDLRTKEQLFRRDLARVRGCDPNRAPEERAPGRDASRGQSALDSMRFRNDFRARTPASTGTSSDDLSNAQTMVMNCKYQIQSSLADFRIKELDLREDLARLQARRPHQDGDTPSYQESQVEQQLLALKEKTTTYQGYLELLNGTGPESFATQIADIQTTRRDLSSRTNTDFNADLRAEKARLENQDRVDAPNWLVQGSFGGFRQ